MHLLLLTALFLGSLNTN